MIYMVQHVFANPALEQAWNEWYARYVHVLVAVPGIHTGQRFRAVDTIEPCYMAMYTVESAAVFQSEVYLKSGGGGTASARFRPGYKAWTRNLRAGAAAPAVGAGQRLLVLDRERPDNTVQPGAPLWLKCEGLHMTTAWRGLLVLDAAAAMPAPLRHDDLLYEPITEQLAAG